MIRLRIISLFLALTMTVQMLPMVQIGCALSANLWTEELPHHSGEDSKAADSTLKNYLPTDPAHFLSDVICSSANSYIHKSEQIPTNHSTDVISPPPDLPIS